MRLRSPWLLLPMFASCVALSGCPGTGEFDGGVHPDAGFVPIGPTAADIGLPCVYDPRDGENPTNQCPPGLECMIVTRDFNGAGVGYNAGFSLDVWEDQFSIYREDGTDVGYCTLKGTYQAPPTCPIGTSLKLFSPNLAVCLRGCAVPADCGRAEYTCDARYIDLPGPTCVRGCFFDVPDCIRNGVVQVNEQGQVATVLALEDWQGSSQCDTSTGICAFVAAHGTASPGQPCTRTEQCEAGAACVQGPVIGNPDGAGFCAATCAPAEDPLTTCTVGYACQPGITLGFAETGTQMALIELSSGQFLLGGGYCFQECSTGVPGNCNATPDTQCGSADEDVFGAPWNGVSMCLPDPLRP